MKHPIIVLVFVLSAMCCMGCSSLRYAPPVCHSVRDTVSVCHLAYDSVYIDRWHNIDHRADTVFSTQIRYEYRYRMLHDTVREVRIDSIPYEVIMERNKEGPSHLSSFKVGITSLLIGLFCGLLIAVRLNL